MTLCRLVYISENQLDQSKGSVIKQLGNILTTSNRNNRELGLTGALLFDDMWFVQALEGERETVWHKFKRISDDERHADVMLVEMRDIPARQFSNWWMGLASRTPTTESAFKPFERNGMFRPKEMAADDIMRLMADLSRYGLTRDVAA